MRAREAKYARGADRVVPSFQQQSAVESDGDARAASVNVYVHVCVCVCGGGGGQRVDTGHIKIQARLN
jgi:hypothetical protein